MLYLILRATEPDIASVCKSYKPISTTANRKSAGSFPIPLFPSTFTFTQFDEFIFQFPCSIVIIKFVFVYLIVQVIISEEKIVQILFKFRDVFEVFFIERGFYNDFTIPIVTADQLQFLKWRRSQSQNLKMSYSSNDVTLETSSDDTSYSIDSNFVENSNQPWKSFKITNSSETSNEYDLLNSAKFSVSSPLGDIQFVVGITKYTLDRAILASKSHHLCHYLTQYHEEEFDDKINNDLTHDDDTRFSNIVDIIYGKELETVLTENNFSQLFEDMYSTGLQIDLKIFKEFIDEKIVKPKAKFSDEMFHLYRILIMNDHHAYDYLLPTVAEQISDHLLEIYDRNIFLSLPVERFAQILLNRKENSKEKGSIGHICAKWICYDFQDRIIHLKDLVNAVKYRYGLFPYSEWVPLMRSWQKNNEKAKPPMEEVEQYFNDLLLFDHGEVSYVFSTNLKDGLRYINPGAQVVHSINQMDQWMSFLEESIFCDVAINVQGAIFKLHRVKLLLASEYFRDLFTNQTESLTSNASDKSNFKSPMKEYSLDQMDPVSFRSIIRYIYEHEIEITSQSHLISLIKGSKFLKMNALFEKCSSIMLEIARNGFESDIFEVFQYACENARCSELYKISAAKVIRLWSKYEEKSNFETISLRTLKEILSLPNLTLKNPNEIVSLCSEWIFFSIENRFHTIIEVAKAINRNFTMDSDKFKLEIPLDLTFSSEDLEQQLIKILSSTTLVSLDKDCSGRELPNPKFLLLNGEKFLTVVDVNFNEIVQLAQIGEADSQYSATIINHKLFILFNIGEKFYFQCYSLVTKKMILLATDGKMDWRQNYVILNCNDEIYYCDEYYILKYVPNLNRWIFFLDVDVATEYSVKYTSDGKNIYKVFKEAWYREIAAVASFYDFQEKKWIALPRILFVVQNSRFNTDEDKIINVNIINHELCVLFSSKTHRFNWLNQEWDYIYNYNKNFTEITEHEKKIVYISDENEILVYSPVLKEWTVEKILDNLSNVVVIHSLEK